MAGGAVIVREATEKDLKPMLVLCEQEWKRLGVGYIIDLNCLRLGQKRGHIIVVYEGERLVTALMGHPMETERGPGNIIDILVVDHGQPNQLTLLDAVSMYACNIAMSEGRRVVFSMWSKATPGIRYGRDVLDFAIDDQLGDVRQVGDAQAVVGNILVRNPEWSLP